MSSIAHQAIPPPRSAWILLGDEGSFYSDTQLQRILKRYLQGKPLPWTGSPRIEQGDLLFVYFMAPRKAIHFVSRAVSRPYKNKNIFVQTEREVSEHQWWVDVTPPIRIQPITLEVLRSIVSEYLNLRGISGKFLDPEDANKLLGKVIPDVASSDPGIIRSTLRRVEGRAELPNPVAMTLGAWRELPSGLLRNEREVEKYVVEPLLALCRIPSRAVTFDRQVRCPEGVPDYLVRSGKRVSAVVEAKQRISAPKAVRGWQSIPDFVQLKRYTDHFGCPGMLVDCDQVVLFPSKGRGTPKQFDRRNLRRPALAEIRKFLLSPT